MMHPGFLLGLGAVLRSVDPYDVASRRRKKSKAATGVKGAQGLRKRKRRIEKLSRKQNRGKR